MIYVTLNAIIKSLFIISDIVNTTQTFTTLIEPVNLDGVIFRCRSETDSSKLISNITFLKEINRGKYHIGI